MKTDDDQSTLAQVLALELAAGLFFNVFILAIVFYDYNGKKNISNSNKILTCLCMANVIYNLMIFAGLLDYFLSLVAPSTFFLSSLYIILLLYSVSSSAWFTASLSVFYFIKISQARLLSWVNIHMSSIVPWMLLVLEVISFISSFLLFSSQTNSRNLTDIPLSVMEVLSENTSRLVNAVIISAFIPLIVAVISTLCTVWTLRQHGQKMEGNMEKGDNRRQMSYLRVVHRMTQLFIFYGIFFSLLLIFYFSIIAQLKSGFWATLLLMSSFTPVQSVLLILGNPRLKDIWKKMLHCDAFTRILSGGKEG